mmetsp:Transcript_121278/g.241584  ORF Transcript_121278/g.241584 Transcript_121278/m.241584 type:complete len:90 (+) Transcript_121278:796-1065(+)
MCKIGLEKGPDLCAPCALIMVVAWPEPTHAEEFDEAVTTIGGCVEPIFGSHVVSAGPIADTSTPSVLGQNREDPDEERKGRATTLTTTT